jgi:hypothetical protein
MAMLSTAFAQYGQNGQRNKVNTKENDVYVSTGNHGYDKHDKVLHGSYVFTAREKDMQIAKINREYDYKIQAVKNRMFIGWFAKMRQVRNLEAQRDEEIRQVMFKFNSPKNMFGDFGKKGKKRW